MSFTATQAASFFDNDVFENIDIANTIGQYYAIFSQVMGKSLNKDSFTDSDLAKFAKRLHLARYERHRFLTQIWAIDQIVDFLNSRKNEVVTNIFSSEDEMKLASNLRNYLAKIGFIKKVDTRV